MDQQAEHNVNAVARSLQAKLQTFAEGLTTEEQAELSALSTQADDVAGHLSPGLAEKGRRAAEALSPEEQAHMSLLLQRAHAGAVTGGELDAQGYMKRLDVDLDMQRDRLGGSMTWTAANFAIAAATLVGALTGAGYGDPSGG
ncbi:MAG: hypothetical protein ACRDJE_04510 [Dehalococcoidia bacterium]